MIRICTTLLTLILISIAYSVTPALADDQAKRVQLEAIAAIFVQRLGETQRVVLKTLSPEDTGLPEDFLRALTSDVEAAFLAVSESDFKLINRQATEDIWSEAIEFGVTEFDAVYRASKADVMLLLSPRVTIKGVDIHLTAYELSGQNLGNVIISSGSINLAINVEESLGVDIRTLNDQVADILDKMESEEKKVPMRAEVEYKKFWQNKETQKGEYGSGMFGAKLVAQVNGKNYIAYESEALLSVIAEKDFDNDGLLDALIGVFPGGNVLPPAYLIVSYKGEGRFVEHPLEFWTHKTPTVFSEGARWVVRGFSESFGAANIGLANTILEYRLDENGVNETNAGSMAAELSLITFTSEEVASKQGSRNTTYKWRYDFDNDGVDEELICFLMARWGTLLDCEILDPPFSYKVVATDPGYQGNDGGAQCKVISVLDGFKDGYRKMTCDFEGLMLSEQPLSKSKYYSDQKGAKCSINELSARVANVNSYTNLRAKAGLGNQVIAQVPLRVVVKPTDPDSYISRDRCLQSCASNDQKGIDWCIENNEVWVEVDYKNRRGFLSRKFLEAAD